MEVLSLTLPTLYADHHVTEVRRLLLEMAGVEEVDASSCFQVVRIRYDPAQTGEAALRARLDEAGYLADVTLPLETDTAPDRPAAYFRHTVAYPQTGRVIGFAQDAAQTQTQEQQHGEKRA